MKKVIRGILLMLAALGLIAGTVACKKAADDKNEPQNQTEAEDLLEYYGCPNSRRIRKLNLKKAKKH